MTHLCVDNLTIIDSDNGLSPARRQAIIWHYPNQCCNIINWTLRNKLQWNLNQNSYIFIQENAFENVVWKMSAILSRPQCVDTYTNHHLRIVNRDPQNTRMRMHKKISAAFQDWKIYSFQYHCSFYATNIETGQVNMLLHTDYGDFITIL